MDVALSLPFAGKISFRQVKNGASETLVNLITQADYYVH